MSLSLDPSLRNLNDCGCCEGISAETPAPVFNRPGLSAISYRVGTHAQAKETMLARLSASHQAALQKLNTRADDDFSIALLDGWATVCDVLTFYQERIANEKYLHTAKERLSVLELARLIGYELRPGVAANTYLAFTLEDAPGAFGQAVNLSNIAKVVPEAPPPITIEKGVKVQSVPGPGEQAVIFETVEAIEARVQWNALKPRLTQPQQLSKKMGSVVLEGTATNLKTGDKLLIDATDGQKPRTIFKVTVDEEARTTRLDFDNLGLSPATYTRPAGLDVGAPAEFAAQTPLNEDTVKAILAKQWSEEDLAALAKMQNWLEASLMANMNKIAASAKFIGGNGVFVFRQRAAVFGHSAPREPAYANGTPKAYAQWADWTPENDEDGNRLFLDAAYDAIVPGSYLAIRKPTQTASVFRVGQAITRSRAVYGMSAKTTVLTLADGKQWWNPKPAGTEGFDVIRGTVVYAQSEQLELANVPIEDAVAGDNITLDRAYLGLKKGQKVIVTGERDDLKGVIVSELSTIKAVLIEAGFTVLVFETKLVNSYLRSMVTINANVAPSTHGESVSETLGSGNATQPFQRFTLRQPPLTYTSASTSTGAQTTLEVRVNDLLWREVTDLYGRAGQERIYVTRTDDEGKTTVIFGDGKTGTRLPTGAENVKATYRKGIGLGGLVKAHQLSQLMTRPLGVKAVTNPFGATDAQDREQMADAKRNAPLTVLTLERVVSLQDYEDFCRAFLGIGKALATWSWIGERRSVLVTVAGVNGAPVSEELRGKLLTALRQFGDPNPPVEVKSYEPRFFRLTAKLQIASDYLPDKVCVEVEAKLRERFSFDARHFGQPVHRSEVIGLMQNVRGVVSVTVTEFYRSDQTGGNEPRLAAARPQLGGDKLFAAELLTLDPRPLLLETIQ